MSLLYLIKRVIDSLKASMNSPLCIFVCTICLSFHSVEDDKCVLPVTSSKHRLREGHMQYENINKHRYLSFQDKSPWDPAFALLTPHCNELSIIISPLRNWDVYKRYVSFRFRPFLSPVMSLSLLLRRSDSVSGSQGMSSSLGSSSTWSRQSRARPHLLCCMKNLKREFRYLLKIIHLFILYPCPFSQFYNPSVTLCQ